MANDSSATARIEKPHAITSISNDNVNDALEQRAGAGATIVDNSNLSQTSEEKIEALVEIICCAGDQSSAALLVLMATLQNAPDAKALANAAKHYAFTHCGELNAYNMVDTQSALFEDQLLGGNVA